MYVLLHSNNVFRSFGIANFSFLFIDQELAYLNKAKTAWKRAFEIHQTETGWKIETGNGQVDGIVYSQNFNGIPKVYRLTVRVPIVCNNVQESVPTRVYRKTEFQRWVCMVRTCR